MSGNPSDWLTGGDSLLSPAVCSLELELDQNCPPSVPLPRAAINDFFLHLPGLESIRNFFCIFSRQFPVVKKNLEFFLIVKLHKFVPKDRRYLKAKMKMSPQTVGIFWGNISTTLATISINQLRILRTEFRQKAGSSVFVYLGRHRQD